MKYLRSNPVDSRKRGFYDDGTMKDARYSDRQKTTAMRPLIVTIERGVSYDEAFRWQMKALDKLKVDSGAAERLFLVEHTPVVTLGRSGDGSNLHIAKEELEKRGIAYREPGRGGDVTYHGPGQWTAYPILRLESFCKDLHRYMRMLEEVTICWLAGYGLCGVRRDGKTGVWVERTGGGVCKIAAIGVGVRRWISFHGTAVNVATDLAAFREWMVPCGITAADGGVTNLVECLGRDVTMDDAAGRWIESFCEVFPFECENDRTD